MDCKGAFLYSQVPGHEFHASEEIVIDFYALSYYNIREGKTKLPFFFTEKL